MHNRRLVLSCNLSLIGVVSYPCLVTCILFYVDSVLRDLHSFPTRRSSDLAISEEPKRENKKRNGLFPARGAGSCPASAGDRKSTRLNSSHTVISYAVFCLKKKSSVVTQLGNFDYTLRGQNCNCEHLHQQVE